MFGTLTQLKDTQVPSDLANKVPVPQQPPLPAPPIIKPSVPPIIKPSAPLPSAIPKIPATQSDNLQTIKHIDSNIPDPLRELVLCSKNYESEPEKLNHLAVQAANLPVVEEISVKAPTSGVKVLAGIFAGTEMFVKKIEDNIKKKFAALEPSDSEEFGG